MAEDLFKIVPFMKIQGFLQKCIKKKAQWIPTDHETYTSLFDAMVMTPYFPHPDLLNLFGRIH